MPAFDGGISTLDSTLQLVATHGWRIFPTILVPRADGRIDKRPAIKNWPNECSRDPRVITRWWAQWPDAVPSLVTGPRNGVVVLDVDVGSDPKTGLPYNGWDSLETIFDWHNAPPTPHVITRRGGSHFYFRCDKLPDSEVLDDRHSAHRTAIKNSVSILAPHIDVRGWNGQVVLPAHGTGYRIDPGLDFSLPLMPCPTWFNHRQPKMFKPHSGGRFDPEAVIIDACNQIRHAREGTRHDAYRHAVFRVARLVGMGLIKDRHHAHSALMGEVMALGQLADGTTSRVEKYFFAAWEEGLAAGERRR